MREEFDNELKVIEIKYPSIRLIIEENNKEYELSISKREQENIFQNFGKIVSTIQEMETLNLEQMLSLIENKKSILSAGINIDNEPRVKVNFSNGEILHYEIKEPDKEIRVDVKDAITREVKREGYEPFKETVTENYEKIQSEVKRLLKQI